MTTSNAIPGDIQAGIAAGEFNCLGSWTLGAASRLERRILELRPMADEIVLDATAISAMDTTGGWLLRRMVGDLKAKGRQVRLQGMRPEFSALLELIESRSPESGSRGAARPGLLARCGANAWRLLAASTGFLRFTGECSIAALRWVAQPRRIRWLPVLHNLQTAGCNALPITGLLTFLLGIVIAYQGAEQLQRFGANVYVADLIGLSMVRELSPLITAIIIAGRSGSAYTAQIGTMKITEEIDALRTIGISPLDLLVLPKVLALMIALPLLTVYTDAMGILGGMFMARAQLGVSFSTFIDRLDEAISLTSLFIGIGKAPVFAVIIALVGCYQGFRVTGGADSVGRQTTQSVVQSIFLVILTDAFFSIAFSYLGI